MGKVIKLTEEDLNRIIREKINEALEHNVDLEYSPAIGNKKRGPGKDSMDQMKKRRNKKLDEGFDEKQGTHDPSVIYDDVYSYIEKDLDKWGAGPVYGWKGDKGVCFSVKKPDGSTAWIVITMMGFNGYYNDDSFLVTISKYGTDERDEADDFYHYVYAGDLNMVIDSLISGNPINESKKTKLTEKATYRRLPNGETEYDEAQLEKIVAESVKNVIKEGFGKSLIPDTPSDLEDEFETEFANFIDTYKEELLRQGFKIEELSRWCHELVDKYVR